MELVGGLGMYMDVSSDASDEAMRVEVLVEGPCSPFSGWRKFSLSGDTGRTIYNAEF
jgi:hypothetical protein